ncbi:hypothetical protein FEM48_Zijuj01G0266300 [Ziziphus jujuba var. spinosa]|uniref:Uncharacterized protein n=1 Tax=Ziziphus jujuba var. spinosa TaxID=714518 RepID=A0A978W519_ZIZJJ|nr:hypothetical protein FEM48_Zijuj01G0266300 [Ziziphus jujuba var. spinosa]
MSIIELKHIQINSPAVAFCIINALVFTVPFKALAEICEAENSLFNMPVLPSVALIGATVGGSISLVEKWLRKLSSLRNLDSTYHPTAAKGIADWASNFANLHSLRLTSIDELGQPSDLKFPDMTKHHNLSELYL